MFDNYPDVVTVKEMQAMLRIGRNSAYKLVNSGRIPSIKIGVNYLIAKKDIELFLSHPVDISSNCAKINPMMVG